MKVLIGPSNVRAIIVPDSTSTGDMAMARWESWRWLRHAKMDFQSVASKSGKAKFCAVSTDGEEHGREDV